MIHLPLTRLRALPLRWAGLALGVAALSSVVIFSAEVEARPDRFKCTIGEHAFLSDSGGLRRLSESSIVGERFAIDRRSGAVDGGPFDTASNGMVPKIIEPGTAEQTFKLLMTSNVALAHTSVHYLEIREAQTGPRKLFVGTRGTEIVNGVCE